MVNILQAVLSPAVTILGFLLGKILEWASRFFYVNMIIYNQVGTPRKSQRTLLQFLTRCFFVAVRCGKILDVIYKRCN